MSIYWIRRLGHTVLMSKKSCPVLIVYFLTLYFYIRGILQKCLVSVMQGHSNMIRLYPQILLYDCIPSKNSLSFDSYSICASLREAAKNCLFQLPQHFSIIFLELQKNGIFSQWPVKKNTFFAAPLIKHDVLKTNLL